MARVDLWIWIFIVGLGAAFPLAAATAVYRTSGENRVRSAAVVGGAMAGWLLLVLALAAAGVFRAEEGATVPLIGAAVAVPITAGILLSRSRRVREAVASMPQSWLLAAQAPRVLGVTFLVLYAQGKLPGHFALGAGIGDIAVGVLAPVAAWYYARRSPGAKGVAVAFNLAGLTDLVVAIGTGFLSAPSALQMFVTEPSTELMTVLPMVVIPTFLLPTFLFVHLLSLGKLAAERGTGARTIPGGPGAAIHGTG